MSTQPIPKVIGADVELSNYLEGVEASETGHIASRLLLKQIVGTPGFSYGAYETNPQDIGRKWLPNGSCCYIDLDHLEICIPEVTNAWDFCAAFHAQLRIVREAEQKAAATLRPGISLHTAVCNSDGNGSSWGSHLNFLITRSAFEAIFKQRLHYLLWLASYQASSVLIHGMGKVGAENETPEIGYQISQRADFMEEVFGQQTTFRRPIINCRDESLCGNASGRARFHHIACDANLCHVANVLKVGILQILLCMVESEACQIRPDVILADPVEACKAFSRSIDLDEKRPTWNGEQLTALDLQRRYFDAASAFVAAGGCEGLVPRAGELINLWSGVLDKLAARDWTALSRSLDWVLKHQVLSGMIEENPELSWSSPEIRRLHLAYGSLEFGQGIYWSLEEAGFVDRLVSERRIDRFVKYPPSDTRAYTRGTLLRTFGHSEASEVDWDLVRIRRRPTNGFGGWPKTVTLADPLDFAKSRMGPAFRRLRREELSKEELLLELAAPLEDSLPALNSGSTSVTYNYLPKSTDWNSYSYGR